MPAGILLFVYYIVRQRGHSDAGHVCDVLHFYTTSKAGIISELAETGPEKKATHPLVYERGGEQQFIHFNRHE